MNYARSQGMFLRCAFAAANNRTSKLNAVDRAVSADPNFVNRHAGILADKIRGFFRDVDILEDRSQDAAGLRAGFGIESPSKGGSDVGRDSLQGKDIELF